MAITAHEKRELFYLFGGTTITAFTYNANADGRVAAPAAIQSVTPLQFALDGHRDLLDWKASIESQEGLPRPTNEYEFPLKRLKTLRRNKVRHDFWVNGLKIMDAEWDRATNNITWEARPAIDLSWTSFDYLVGCLQTFYDDIELVRKQQ